MNFTSHLQQGTILHIVWIGEAFSAVLETLYVANFHWTHMQPAVPLDFFFSSKTSLTVLCEILSRVLFLR